MVDRNLIKRSVRAVLLFLVLCSYQSALTRDYGSAASRSPALTREGCTIGVVSASATSDGRPLLWKIRDNADLPNNSVSFDTSFPRRFIAVTNSGDKEVWMGVNEKGFAIINSTSLDLPGGSAGLNNGLLMRYALGTCVRVGDFELLLDSTNATGRQTQGNFGVIDTTGAAIMFEVSGNAFWMFDANDTVQATEGFVLRTNFSMTGGGSTGIERYRRAATQITEFRRSGTLDYQRIIRPHARDISDYSSRPLPVPYPHAWTPSTPLGYVYSNVSVCRHKSISAAAIVGVKAGENPTLSTMWTILGQPALGIAVPYWPVGDPPDLASGSLTSPLDAIANKIRSLVFDIPMSPDYLDTYKLRDECGNGLWSITFPAEDSILNAGEALLGRWRKDLPPTRSIQVAENTLASSAFSHLTRAYERLTCRSSFAVANSVPYEDENGKTLEHGDIVQLIWAGEDGKIDPPNTETGSPHWGQPSGDDHLIGIPHVVGENASSEGMFGFQAIAWTDHANGAPAAGDLVYLRAFNSTSLETSTHYGDARPYQVSTRTGTVYTPLITDGRTTRLLRGIPATDGAVAHFRLSPNFPNPFNSSTSIEYEVPYALDSTGPLDITVFNNLGQAVRTLFSGMSPGGKKKIEWDGRDNSGHIQPSGVYYLRLKAGPTTDLGRMLLLK